MPEQRRDDDFSLTKLTTPKIEGILPRYRLFHIIDEKRKRPVLWVSGPGGSGKTTLISSYLKLKDLSHLWYRVDERDNDPATFFYYLGMAGMKASGNRKPMPLFGPEYMQNITVFALRFFEELFSRLKNRILLVFDNYHRIPEQSRFHEAICAAFSAMPEGGNVIVISRHDVPKSMIRLQTNGAVNRITWKDLRLNLEEAAGIAGIRRPDIQPEEIQRLHRDSAGWIGGLVLMLEGEISPGITEHSEIRSHDEIVAYFGNQVFDRLEGKLQRFLLKTSFLPRITVKAAEELTGLPDSADLLNRLYKNGNFTERDSSKKPVFRYHQLMREFLIARARSEMSPAEIETLTSESARLLEASGSVEYSAELRIAQSDWENLAGIILKHAPGFLSQGRYQVLDEWLTALPLEVIDASPWLLYWKAVCLGFYNPLESTKLFERAFRNFEEQNEEMGMLLAWCGAVDSIVLSWENFAPLASWLEWMDARLVLHPEFPSRQIEAHVAVSMMCIFTCIFSARPDVKQWVNRAMNLLPEIGNESMQLHALSNAFIYFFWNGDVENILPFSKQAESIARSGPASPLSLIMCKIIEMISNLMLSENNACIKTAGEALELADKHGVYLRNNTIYFVAVFAALSLNDLKLVEEYLRQMDLFSVGTPRGMLNQNQYGTGLFHFLKGNPRYALTLARKGLEISIECATIVPEILFRQLLAKILHMLGERDAALSEVTRTKKIISEKWNSPLFLYATLLDEAHFLFDLKEEKPALEALRSAMKVGAEHNFRTILMHWRPAILAELCIKALENDIEIPYVKKLIEDLKLVPEIPPYKTALWPWPIKIYTLGQFKILCNGESVEFSRKVKKKPLDLLKVLLALGGKGIRKEVITDIMWPEAEGDASSVSFDVTLKRLRDLLGYPDALQLQNGLLTLDNRLCWVDFWAFDHLIDNIEPKLTTESALRAAQKAVDMYSGHFLPGEMDSTWSLSLREQLRSKYVAAIRWLGNSLEICGKWQEAAEYYERGLDVDDLAEELYQRLMKCHIQLDRKSEAILVYARCKKMLLSVLGIAPSDKTEKMYQSVKGACIKKTEISKKL